MPTPVSEKGAGIIAAAVNRSGFGGQAAALRSPSVCDLAFERNIVQLGIDAIADENAGACHRQRHDAGDQKTRSNSPAIKQALPRMAWEMTMMNQK
jgi:hypothetical protein